MSCTPRQMPSVAGPLAGGFPQAEFLAEGGIAVVLVHPIGPPRTASRSCPAETGVGVPSPRPDPAAPAQVIRLLTEVRCMPGTRAPSSSGSSLPDRRRRGAVPPVRAGWRLLAAGRGAARRLAADKLAPRRPPGGDGRRLRAPTGSGRAAPGFLVSRRWGHLRSGLGLPLPTRAAALRGRPAFRGARTAAGTGAGTGSGTAAGAATGFRPRPIGRASVERFSA